MSLAQIDLPHYRLKVIGCHTFDILVLPLLCQGSSRWLCPFESIVGAPVLGPLLPVRAKALQLQF
jgi:hypothetical protein